MNRSFWLCIALGMILVAPRAALAIPPPDLIANLGSQFAQVFSLLAVLLSAGAGAAIQASHKFLRRFQDRKVLTALAAFVVIVISLVVTYVIVIIVRDQTMDRYEQEVSDVIQSGIEEHDLVPVVISDEGNAFFEINRNLPLSISNDEFELAGAASIFVLDAREDEEYELGHYQGSKHIRFADLIAGAWTEVPTDRVVYVLCWSGIRGQEVTEFLRTKGVVARYLVDGAKGWVDYGGVWEGEILFKTKYSEERYTGTLSTAEVREQVLDGAVLVDARRTETFNADHIEGALNITIFFTPSDELVRLLEQIPAQSRVITICDDYVSCFDAKIAGVKLEKLGHTFLGRYAEPQAF